MKHLRMRFEEIAQGSKRSSPSFPAWVCALPVFSPEINWLLIFSTQSPVCLLTAGRWGLICVVQPQALAGRRLDSPPPLTPPPPSPLSRPVQSLRVYQCETPADETGCVTARSSSLGLGREEVKEGEPLQRQRPCHRQADVVWMMSAGKNRAGSADRGRGW